MSGVSRVETAFAHMKKDEIDSVHKGLSEVEVHFSRAQERKNPLRWGDPHLFFYGVLVAITGVVACVIGAALFTIVSFMGGSHVIDAGLLLSLGTILVPVAVVLAMMDLRFLRPTRHIRRLTEGDGFTVRGVTVALTAYNDEGSIGQAVRDFLAHPLVKRVLVVSNNSTDQTIAKARAAGAIVHNEEKRGYGRCVYRRLVEAAAYEDTECVALCEGDMTFRARDLTKFFAYLPHAEIVNGTRIVEQLRSYKTQLSTFIYYGNFVGGKLLEAKHLGRGTFTDVGATYKVLRRNALQRLLPELNPDINLEFNAHFLDTALGCGYLIVECPITFHSRVGQSKGGNVNDTRALVVGLRMLFGLTFGWKKRRPALAAMATGSSGGNG